MSSSFSEPTDSLWAVDREGLYSGDPHINSALFCVPAGDSISEATVADKQGMVAFHHGDRLEASSKSPLHFHHVGAEMGAFIACIQPVPQLEPNLLTYRARPFGAGEHVTIQDTRKMNRKTQNICTDCNKGFGRAQELARHRKDVHEQRRHCLFCGFKWTRPSNIKAHLLTKHSEKFTAELLVMIQVLRGRLIVAFLDAYNQGSGPV